jgi:hypothetical protein
VTNDYLILIVKYVGSNGIFISKICAVSKQLYTICHINSVCLNHTVGLWTSASFQEVSRFHLCFVALLPMTHAVKSVGLKCEI